MDKTNQQILLELKTVNKNLTNLLIFLVAREGYSDSQIRAIFGKIDNNRIRHMGAGLKNKKK